MLVSSQPLVLNDPQGVTLTHEDRPSKIREYFQYAHNPSRGDSLVVPGFCTEVTKWWRKIQPEWRRSGQDPPQGPSQWSYVLSGGSKGIFLVVMCLAWWHRAHVRYLEEQRTVRSITAAAAQATPNFDDLPEYDVKWLNVVNDLTFVMGKAQGCGVPARGAPAPSRGTKRSRETALDTPRKKSTVSAPRLRTRSKA